MSNEKEKETSLMDFSWDDSEGFFGINTEVKDEVKQPSTIIESDDEESDKPTNLDKKKESQPEKEEDNFFDDDDNEPEKTSQTFSYSNVYKNLKEKGIISIEVDNENEIDEETFIQIQEEEIEARLDETIKAFMDELDSDAKAFLKFKKEGGDTQQFFKIYNELSQIPTPVRGDDKSEEKFLKHYYKNYEELDDDDIDDKIEWLKETGKLSKYAQKYYEDIEEEIETRREETIKRQQEIQKQQEEQRKNYIKDLKNIIEEKNQIKDWSLTQKDKKELHGYMTKAAVKVSENSFLTQFQHDLQEAFKDKEKTILLAKLLANNFDLTDLKEKAKTELVRETKDKLNNSKTSPVGNKGSRNKGLVDYF
jgi:hypothetical protein